jgi:hypothetical protein
VYERPDIAPGEQLEARGVGVTRWGGVENDAAAHGRSRPQHDTIAARGHGGGSQPELGVPLADPHDTRVVLGRSVVDVETRAVRDGLELVEFDVEAVADRIGIGGDERVAPAQMVAFETRQRDGDALPGLRALGGLVMHLDAANANLDAAGLGNEHVAHADGAGPQRSGGDGSDSAQAEHAVDEQARRAR